MDSVKTVPKIEANQSEGGVCVRFCGRLVCRRTIRLAVASCECLFTTPAFLLLSYLLSTFTEIYRQLLPLPTLPAEKKKHVYRYRFTDLPTNLYRFYRLPVLPSMLRRDIVIYLHRRKKLYCGTVFLQAVLMPSANFPFSAMR